MNATTLHRLKLTLLHHVMLVIICTFCFGKGNAQKILVNGAISTGKLKWSDFTGKPDKSSSFAAYTSYNSGWKMKSGKVSGDSVLIEGFEFTVELSDKNSWVKMDRATPHLLLHEQGHFNMGILAGQEIMDTLRKTKFSPATYRTALPAIVTGIARKYSALGVQYDKETDHSKNIEGQNKWNAFFAERLPELYK